MVAVRGPDKWLDFVLISSARILRRVLLASSLIAVRSARLPVTLRWDFDPPQVACGDEMVMGSYWFHNRLTIAGLGFIFMPLATSTSMGEDSRVD